MKSPSAAAPDTGLASAQAIIAARPQAPVKPYPYREERVGYPGGAPGVRLAATLTLPEGVGPFPAVVLIAGAGPHNRDQEWAGHATFLVLADHLTRRGVATLRFDKRGVGESTGDHAAATTADFADDAGAGVAFLRERPEINPRSIGLIGHSEGGLIAPIVAGDDPGVAFIVLLAGPGAPGHQIVVAQSRAIAIASGANPAAADEAQAFQRLMLDASMAAKDQMSAEAAVRDLLVQAGMAEADAEVSAKTVTTPWFRYFLVHDPEPVLRGLRIPVLALVGSKDRQVPAELNIPALRKALADHPHAEVLELDGLNHQFQEAETGAPTEYSQIDETLSPAVMDRVTDWVLAQAAREIEDD